MNNIMLSYDDFSDKPSKRNKRKIKTVISPKRNRRIEDIVFQFKNVKIRCELDQEVFSTDDLEKVDYILKSLSKDIQIDKTFVDFEGTKFEKTFITELGWNELLKLIAETDYGRYLTKAQKDILFLSYKSMLICYIQDFFSDLGWDITYMDFFIQDDSFTVEYWPDTAKEWLTYPGKWQTWPENNL